MKNLSAFMTLVIVGAISARMLRQQHQRLVLSPAEKRSLHDDVNGDVPSFRPALPAKPGDSTIENDLKRKQNDYAEERAKAGDWAPHAPPYLEIADAETVIRAPGKMPDGSDGDKADLAVMQAVRKDGPSAQQCEQAETELDYRSLGAFFGTDAEGRPLLTADQRKKLTAYNPQKKDFVDDDGRRIGNKFMDNVMDDMDGMTWPYKTMTFDHDYPNGSSYPSHDKYNRKRPFIAHPNEVKPCPGLPPKAVDPVEIGSSYPSAHTAAAYVEALVLGEICGNTGRYLKRAEMIGNDRVILGVHYPSDVAAGKIIGELIFEKEQASPRFQKDLADAKAAVGSCD